MWRAKGLPRKIDPLSVEDGDRIVVSWSNGGIKYTKEATVYRHITSNQAPLTEYFTEEGTEIFHYLAGSGQKINVTLLSVAEPPQQVTLTTLEELEEMLQ